MTKTLDNVSNIMDLTNNKSKSKSKSKSKKKLCFQRTMVKTLNNILNIMDLTNNKSISKKSYLQRIITKKLNRYQIL